MTPPYDVLAPKKPTNLSINSDLLRRARELDINLSATLEAALANALKERQRKEWKAANRAAIAGYNELVEIEGVFSDGLRQF